LYHTIFLYSDFLCLDLTLFELLVTVGAESTDEEFGWPAGIMIAGVVVWICLVLWQVLFGRLREWPRWIEQGLCLGAGGLVLVSGFVWLLTDDSAVGQIVRLGLLLGMTAYAYWRIGKSETRALMAASVIQGILVLLALI